MRVMGWFWITYGGDIGVGGWVGGAREEIIFLV